MTTRFAPPPQNASALALSRRTFLAAAGAAVVGPAKAFAQSAAADEALAQIIASDHRSARNRARDPWRRPAETVAFLGVKPSDTVVEILPGSVGYWLEILAPWLKDQGRYIAAGRDEAAAANYLKDHERLLAKLAADPARYGRVEVTKFNAGKHPIATADSADFVLTFRNLHNWIDRNEIDGALKAFHTALRPGGVLGVADHRGRTDAPQAAQMRTGYVRQDYATALIEKAGFRLAGASEVLANPGDTKDHPNGVWSLPPSFRGGDTDRERFAAIGESDRFLLKFEKV